MLFLNDDDVLATIDMLTAVDAIEPAFRAKAQGAFLGPPRHRLAVPGRGELVFTTGGMTDGPVGFRVYDTLAKGLPNPQLVVVWEAGTGRLKGVVAGERVGKMRTGAIGGLAIRYMARADAHVAAVIGAGAQARTQLEAAVAVRPVSHARVYSPTPASRERFAAEMEARLGVVISPCATPRDAVIGADIVICATTSGEPVIDADWLKQGVHINTVGPKVEGRHELPLDVAAAAAVIATDSLEQIAAMAPPFFLASTSMSERIVDLSQIIAGVAPGRNCPDDLTLFCSAGLAGTEVLLASAVLTRAELAGREQD